MKAVVTGGGSGGHVYPAIAIADKIKERDPSSDVIYAAYGEFVEEKVPKTGYDLKIIDARRFEIRSLKDPFSMVYHIGRGILQAKKLFKEYKPDVVIGTGGYACFPVIYAAHSLKIKCYIHEQNAFPGKANKKLAEYVDKVFLGFEEGGEYFHEKEKLVYVGNPVREVFYNLSKNKARENLGIDKDDFTVFLFGGSLGAKALNDVGIELAKAMSERPNEKFIFGTGKDRYDEVMTAIKEQGITLGDNIRITDYIDDMDNTIGSADLIISRAGALSISETLAAGRASILVPLPTAAGNHQYFNAKAVADEGAALMIEEKDLTAELLIETVNDLKENPDKLSEMEAKALKMSSGEKPTDIIYEEILKDLGK